MRDLCRVEDLGRIYVMIGEFDESIEQLEHLLSILGPYTISLLRLEPAWDPLRTPPLPEAHRIRQIARSISHIEGKMVGQSRHPV